MAKAFIAYSWRFVSFRHRRFALSFRFFVAVLVAVFAVQSLPFTSIREVDGWCKIAIYQCNYYYSSYVNWARRAFC